MTIDIERINFLARKAKSEGLTDEEKAEQAALRRAFADSVKADLRAQLKNTYIKRESGEIVRLTARASSEEEN